MDPLNDNVFRDLEKLNFTVNESKVYLTLIKLGPSKAGTLAKEAKLDRSSTYNALTSLVKKGIISTIFKNERTTYIPEDPKKIVDYFKEKEEIANNIIPGLQEQFKFRAEKSTVKLFQGYKGIKTVFQNILDTCGDHGSYSLISSEGKFSEKMPYYAPIFSKRREMKKIKTRVLVREGRKVTNPNQYKEYRYFPSDIISPATINIYGNKVSIVIWEDTPQAVVIESQDVAKSFESYFQFMWKNAKKK